MRWSGIFNPPPLGQTGDSPTAQGPTADLQGETADSLARRRYLGALRSNAPSGWMSSHLTESWRMRGAVYVAIKVLSDQAAQCEMKVWQWTPEAREEGDESAKKAVPRTHELCRFLRRPNRHETAAMLRRRMVQQLSLTGTSLLWRVDDGFDRPVEMWSTPTGTYTPIPMSQTYPDGGYRIMPYFPGPMSFLPGVWSAGGVVVDANYIIATRYPHPLVQAEGLSPLSACDLSLDSFEQLERTRFNILRKGINPSGTVELAAGVKFPDPDELTRITAQLQQLLGTPDKAGTLAILGEGMKLSPWGHGEVEMGWLKSWDQLVTFILAIFGITKSVAFMQEDTSYAALYAGLQQHSILTMSPLLELLAESLNMQLVWPFWGEDYYLELLPRKINDEQLEETKIANDLKGGIMTVNEFRKRRNMPETTEEWGKERAGLPAPKEEKPEGEEGGLPGMPGSGKQPGFAGPNTQTPGKPKDEAMEKERPRNPNGAGSLPPRGGKHYGRLEQWFRKNLNGHGRVMSNGKRHE